MLNIDYVGIQVPLTVAIDAAPSLVLIVRHHMNELSIMLTEKKFFCVHPKNPFPGLLKQLFTLIKVNVI